MKKPILIFVLDFLKPLDRILIIIHIIRRTVNFHKQIPKKINYKLDKYEHMFYPNYHIKFTILKDDFSILLNGKAIKPNGILITPEWAARLLLFDDEFTLNAFLVTIGHEMSHNEGDFPPHKLLNHDKKFVNWVNEVHHDFGGAEKMVNSSKEKLLASMAYKIKSKSKKKKCIIKQLRESSHPSWEQRKEYAETGTFNETLIRRIASDTDCFNEGLKRDVIKFYHEIILK